MLAEPQCTDQELAQLHLLLQIDQRVRVIHDIPELELRCGDVGRVCSTWFEPTIAYEVEFRRDLPSYGVRALLMPNQISADTEVHG